MRNFNCLLFLLVSFLFVHTVYAQPTLYGLSKVPGVEKRIYLSKIIPATGAVNMASVPLVSEHLSLGTGNMYNFDRGLYYYLSPANILTEANVYNSASQALNINLSGCNLVSAHYTCFDSSVYGFQYCSGVTGAGFGKYDVTTGAFLSSLTSFSSSPGDDYTYDKVNHRYIFTSSSTLYSIDLNTMTVSNFTLPIPSGSRFRFPQYNCNDSLIYGCYVLQGSIGMRLASYSMQTGSFTVLSSAPVVNGGILGGGTALDVPNGLYYYNVGSSIISIRLSDGSIAANQPYTFSSPGPTNVYYIQIDQNCDCERSLTADIENENLSGISVMNPFTDLLKVSGISTKVDFKLYDVTMKLLIDKELDHDTALDTEFMQAGVYFYSIEADQSRITGKLIKQ